MIFRLLTAPAAEPISLSDAKAFLRVDDSSDDSLISALISGARQLCEEYTSRAFITQTWELWSNSFAKDGGRHTAWWDGVREGPISMIPGCGGRTLDLARAPLQSITLFEVFDLSNTNTTVDSSTYFLDVTSEPGRIVLNDGAVWPPNLRSVNGIHVQFKVGYGDTGTSVPPVILTAIKQVLAHFYENREIVIDLKATEIPMVAQALLNPYRLMRLQ